MKASNTKASNTKANTEHILKEILKAKEERSARRYALAHQSLVGISLSFNIAAYPKSNSEIEAAFNLVLTSLKRFLYAHRILLDSKNEIQVQDAAGDFYLSALSYCPIPLKELKDLCEKFEMEHPLHRLIDVDLMDETGHMISSHKQKSCFICAQPAVKCLKEKTHSVEEIRAYIFSQINTFLQAEDLEQCQKELSSAATQALLYEVSLSPKPGLVDRYGAGSHSDMDFFTFVNSIAALAPYWERIVALAYRNKLDKAQENESLRLIGIEMEEAMLKATAQVNTQRGAIFILGYLVYVVAQLRFQKQMFRGAKLSSDIDDKIRAGIQRLHADSMEDALLKSGGAMSNGRKVIADYGTDLGGGIRKEMAEGLPILFTCALPFLEANISPQLFFHNSKAAQEILKSCLLHIIQINKDTNILHRSKPNILNELQELAKKNIKEKQDFDDKYRKICDFCKQNNISPGGSADLLAASIFIFRIKTITE